MAEPRDRFRPSTGTVTDMPDSGMKMELVCAGCGTKHPRAVGRILIDPEYVDQAKAGEHLELEPYLFFSAYLRCRNCNATHWKLTPDARFKILSAIVPCASGRKFKNCCGAD